MKVKELREVTDEYNQRVVIEDEWSIFVDTDVYDSDICSNDEVKRIYIDDDKTIHIVVKN